MNIFNDYTNPEFSYIELATLLDLKTKCTDISYDIDLSTTTIANNCFINSLSCGNFNVLHITGTTSNLQAQLDNLQTQVTAVQSQADDLQTQVSDVQTQADDLQGQVDTVLNGEIQKLSINYETVIYHQDNTITETYIPSGQVLN